MVGGSKMHTTEMYRYKIIVVIIIIIIIIIIIHTIYHTLPSPYVTLYTAQSIEGVV
jgi:hypothetical protein